MCDVVCGTVMWVRVCSSCTELFLVVVLFSLFIGTIDMTDDSHHMLTIRNVKIGKGFPIQDSGTRHDVRRSSTKDKNLQLLLHHLDIVENELVIIFHS